MVSLLTIPNIRLAFHGQPCQSPKVRNLSSVGEKKGSIWLGTVVRVMLRILHRVGEEYEWEMGSIKATSHIGPY